ncbi:MAG: LPS export ABC transporter ATP-binding protein [Gammaproteobacteria bacterium]|nr:LPS export ABC transporter ATP-binding protein [Gammaproteobacteria bacterium]
MTSLLCAHGLKKSYRRRAVVKDVSLAVQSGQVVGLLGPNGAGKTTCFYMFVGIIACDSGKIMLDTKAITYLPIHRRAELGIGYLPQEPSVFRKLTVEQNILATLELQKGVTAKQRQRKLEALLDRFHLSHVRENFGMSLSGGERRRVEIARTLASTPRFILLDEPFTGVDPLSIVDIKRLIGQLTSQGIGVFITDHHVREMLDICHHTYIMNEGTLIAEGSPDTIAQNEQVKTVFLGKDFQL